MVKAAALRDYKHQTVPGTISTNDMDTMADTCCAGKNWTPIYFTGVTVEVSPFTDTYQAIKDIPVATCATKVTSESGQVYLIVAHELLFFGASLKRSLLNPNQMRMAGIRVVDDPTVQDGFGIHTDGLFIPFDTKGTAVYFTSEAPSQEEIESLAIPHIVVTKDEPWDPQTVQLRPQTANDNGSVPFEVRNIGLISTGNRPIETTGRLLDHGYEHLLDVSPSLSPFELDRRIINAVNVRDVSDIGAVQTETRHSEVTPSAIAKKFNISLETAERTLDATTQAGIRTAKHPMVKRYRIDHLHLNRRMLPGTWYCDLLYSKVKSLDGNTCAVVITNGSYTRVTPLASARDASTALKEMAEDVGAPAHLVADLDPVLSGKHTEWMKLIRHYKIRLTWSEKGRKNQNHRAEGDIGHLKTRWKTRMMLKGIHRRLWDRVMVYEAEILSLISRGKGNRTGLEQVTGMTPDISEYCDFEPGDEVWYYPGSGVKLDTVDDPRQLGLWLGVSHRVGSDMCYWILTASGKIIANTSVQHIIRTERENPSIARRIQEFQERLDERLRDDNFKVPESPGVMYLQDEEGEKVTPRVGIVPEDAEYGDIWGIESVEPDRMGDSEDAYDKYIGAQLLLDLDGDPLYGKVIERATDQSGNRIGTPHKNPFMDTREYLVRFKDESVRRYTANQIAQSIYSQVDDEGRSRMLIEEVIGHKRDGSALRKEDGYWISYNGNKTPKRTTRGWKICLRFKDGTIEWFDLKDVKDSYPVELAEYAVQNSIVDEPAFKWWAPEVFRTRNRIIGKVKNRYWATTHKFGIRLPKTVEEAIRIDTETGTDYWKKAIQKERDKVRVAWKPLEDVTPDQIRSGKSGKLVGYQEIDCHMVFDVKMDFTRKARFVAGGNTTEAPSSMTYSSVVSRDSVRILLTVAALNDLDVYSCDVANAYLNAPCREKIWFEGGTECGDDRGKVLVVVRALYGLKSSGASWRQMMKNTLLDMDFFESKGDPDVYMRETTDKDGNLMWEYILCYVDDILAISHRAKEIIGEIGKRYSLRDMMEPELYLGAEVGKQQLDDGTMAWYMSADKYIAGALLTVKGLFKEDGKGRQILRKDTPLPSGWKPELDVSEELDDKMVSRYRQLIGILRWAVELGRLDIFHEVSILSQFQALPREGHLEACYHMFDYLNNKNKVKMVFDYRQPYIDEKAFKHNVDWKPFYGDVVEELPANMPTPRGYAVYTSSFVDSNHAGNVVTRRSHSGILLMINKAPVVWYSKRQNTVEASTFGSEFIALRLAKEMIVALRYKLRMFGIPIAGPTDVFCDNEGVVKNTSIPESVLNKKHLSIAYHSVREAAAAGILRVGKEDTDTNLADLFTKCLTKRRRNKLLGYMLYGPFFDADMYPEAASSRKRKARSEDGNGEGT